MTDVLGEMRAIVEGFVEGFKSMARMLSRQTVAAFASAEALARFNRRVEDHAFIVEERRKAEVLVQQHLAATAARVYADLGIVPPADSVVRRVPGTV